MALEHCTPSFGARTATVKRVDQTCESLSSHIIMVNSRIPADRREDEECRYLWAEWAYCVSRNQTKLNELRWKSKVCDKLDDRVVNKYRPN